MDLRQTCFVDMPSGKKVDPGSRVEIDLDQICEATIKPAIETVGLECIRGDAAARGPQPGGAR